MSDRFLTRRGDRNELHHVRGDDCREELGAWREVRASHQPAAAVDVGCVCLRSSDRILPIDLVDEHPELTTNLGGRPSLRILLEARDELITARLLDVGVHLVGHRRRRRALLLRVREGTPALELQLTHALHELRVLLSSLPGKAADECGAQRERRYALA